ncbi:MAG: response regulator [Leptospiraceae bacterium]|nr:response regulator [Leptospiraceae bacterium]
MKNRLIAVDDDPAILELIEIALEDTNFEIISATNGKEALDLYLKDPSLVILSDLKMPEIDGKELMQKVFESGYKPVFIMLTSETDVNNVIELFKLGIHDYIIEPFNDLEYLVTFMIHILH